MSNDFKKAPEKYPMELEKTTYMKALKGYYDRYGKEVTEKKFWRLACFITIFCCFCSNLGTIWIGMQSKVVPYIVRADSNGAVISVDKVDKQPDADEKVKEHYLWRIIKNIRTLPKDMIIYRQNWEEAYCFLSREVTNKINDMALAENHREKLKQGFTTQLNLTSVSKIAGQANTYQVRWEEKSYDTSGNVLNQKNFEAIFVIDRIHELAEEIVYVNPLGIIVKDFTWSQER